MGRTIKQIRATHDALADMTERLISEYESRLPPGAVIRCVARTVQRLRQEGVPSERLAASAEPLARYYLEERIRED